MSILPRRRSCVSLIVILGLLGLTTQCSPKADKPESTNKSKTTSTGAADRSTRSTPQESKGKARGSKTPERALPRLADGIPDAVRKLLDDAKASYNRAISENNKSRPDKNLFFEALNTCKSKLDEADTRIEPVTMWEEESTMGDWKVSEEEDAYLRTVLPLIARIDKLRSAAEKISRAR